MLEAIRGQGFRGEVVESAPEPATAAGRRIDPTRLPEDLQGLLRKARGEGKPVLAAFHGPGCLPCKRMDARTYPDAGVKQELAHWLLVRVDVAERREVAGLFEVAAIPVVVAVDGQGEELGRIENYVEPAPFRQRLEGLRRPKGR